jgi:hypothetical protein
MRRDGAEVRRKKSSISTTIHPTNHNGDAAEPISGDGGASILGTTRSRRRT